MPIMFGVAPWTTLKTTVVSRRAASRSQRAAAARRFAPTLPTTHQRDRQWRWHGCRAMTKAPGQQRQGNVNEEDEGRVKEDAVYAGKHRLEPTRAGVEIDRLRRLADRRD